MLHLCFISIVQWAPQLTFSLQQGVTELGVVLLSLQLSKKLYLITWPPVPLHGHMGTGSKKGMTKRNVVIVETHTKLQVLLLWALLKTYLFTAAYLTFVPALFLLFAVG